jgi:multisubunit Na+/H+ antiporter MnhC subunit
MELLLAIVAGVLYASGLYLMLRRRLAQLIIGLGRRHARQAAADDPRSVG